MRVTTGSLQQLHPRTSDAKFLSNQQETPSQQQLPAHKSADEVAFPTYESSAPSANPGPKIIGNRFLIIGPTEGSTLFKCVDVVTGQKLIAKSFTMGDKGDEALLQAHLRMQDADVASPMVGVVDAPCGKKYLLFEGHHGDMHSYIRARRRLRESEARRLFRQVARIVAKCHENGVVLRDLKLRKFVFADKARTQLRLEIFEDAIIIDTDNDHLTERRGCPAYVAPEVLRFERAYAGKAADIWSLGILLYTMIVGRYPFHDITHVSLFAKISRGQYAIPESVSSRARCLIKAILRRDPDERPVARDVLHHPWLVKPKRRSPSVSDRMVPEFELPQD